MVENKYFCMVAKGEPASGEFLVRGKDQKIAKENLAEYVRGRWLGIGNALLHFVEMSPAAQAMLDARRSHPSLEIASLPVTVTRMYEDNPMAPIKHTDGTMSS